MSVLPTDPQKPLIKQYSSTDPSKDFKVHNPATGAVIATIRAGDSTSVSKAVEAAHTAFNKWRFTTLAERTRLMLRCAEALEEKKEELAELLCSENGKPYTDALMFDCTFVHNIFSYYGGLIDKLPGEWYDRGPVYVNVVREPHGVCLGVIPFNWPPIHTGGKIAPCIAMGNTMIIKPGEQAPLTCVRIVDIINTILPEGVVTCVPGFGPEVPQNLAAHPQVKMISLTGSTAAGAAVAKTASAAVKPTALELGGKNAFVVFDDADIDRALRDAVEAGYFNKGEACTAGSRVLVHEKIHDQFVQRMAAAVKRLRAGNGMKKETHVGPVVTQAQKDRVSKYIKLAQDEGAKIAAEGLISTEEELKGGFYIAPTLLVGVERSHTVAKDEIFGPVVTVCKFSTEAEAVSIVNEVAYGLVCGIYSKDPERTWRVSRQVDVGIVYVNNYQRNALGVPFGGVKATGNAREHSIETLKDWSNAKIVQQRTGLGQVPNWRAVVDVFD